MELLTELAPEITRSWGGVWQGAYSNHTGFELRTHTDGVQKFQHLHGDILFRNLYIIQHEHSMQLSDQKTYYFLDSIHLEEEFPEYQKLLQDYAKKYPKAVEKIETITHLKVDNPSQSFLLIQAAARAFFYIIQNNRQALVDDYEKFVRWNWFGKAFV